MMKNMNDELYCPLVYMNDELPHYDYTIHQSTISDHTFRTTRPILFVYHKTDGGIIGRAARKDKVWYRHGLTDTVTIHTCHQRYMSAYTLMMHQSSFLDHIIHE